jgi:hypothetical protein
MLGKPSRSKLDKTDPEATAAKARVVDIIDSVPPADLVASIKRAPSLRGMILGYIAEEMFEKHLPQAYPQISPSGIAKHDDHDRKSNKSDRTIAYNGRLYRIQLKSIQTNSICRNISSGLLQADVQNDASDRRKITLPNGHTVDTTCYARDDYDILAIPLYPLSGEWNFAYKRNRDFRSTESKKYKQEDQQYLLSTLERIHWRLDENWHTNIVNLLDGKIGIIPEPT